MVVLGAIGEINIQAAIDRWHKEHREPPRPHLGLSLLGHPCDRWIWLSFRWAVREDFSGRMLRLFRRGKREEETIVRDLRAIGISIHSTCLDPDGQSRVDFGCHVSGSIDGIIEQGVPGAEKTRHIAEFKTHNCKSFAELKAKGVLAAKRQHWWQMQGYMLGTGIERALYVAVCKDNDEMYTERVSLDKPMAEALIDRGHKLALEEELPEPLSADPSYFECQMCPANDFCHFSHLSTCVNCRTCSLVTPTADGNFVCWAQDNYVLSPEEQLTGCRAHIAHRDLVPWRYLGAEEDTRAVRYEIQGKEYLNGDRIYHSEAMETNELLIIGQQTPQAQETPF